MKLIIEYLLLKTLIQYSVLNKEDVKQVTTISEEKNETPIIIETGYYEPMSSPTDKSILGDILEEAFKIMEKEYKLIYCQWAVCLYNLDKCEVWGVTPAAYTEERAKKYLYSDPLIDTQYKFFFNKDKIKEENIYYNTLKDLRHYIIGIIPEYFFQEKVKENFSFIKWFISEESQLEGLRKGNIQLAPMDEVIGWYYINKNYPNEIEKFGTLDKPFTIEKEESRYIMVCKNYPNAEEILDEFNDALKILKDTGVVKEILEKYGVEEYVEVVNNFNNIQ